jgi:hypothetical protein
MAELTQQDLDNYNKLTEAFKKITIGNDQVLKAIDNLIPVTVPVKNTEELSAIVSPLYSYWKVLSDLKTPLKFSPTNFEQQFSDAIENLKRSLEVVEDEELDLTDEIENFQPDSLFLDFIPGDDPQRWTKILIDDRDPNLDSGEIDQLTQSWRTAVDKFVKDAIQKNELGSKVNPGEPDTFASFFRIHKELEILYSRLADTEAV